MNLNILQSQEVLDESGGNGCLKTHAPTTLHWSQWKTDSDNWYKIYGGKSDKEQDIYKVLGAPNMPY